MSFIKATGKCFNYHGRWSRTEDGMMQSHWPVYFDFRIKAESFTLIFDRRTQGYTYSLDGNLLSAVGSSADAKFYVDPNEFHTVRISYCNGKFPMYFKGIETDGEVKAAPDRPKYNLFVGDLFSTALSYFPERVISAEKCDHDTIAMTGIALCNGHGTYSENPIGMETALFCLECPKEEVPLTELDTKKLRVPDKIFISLGLGDDLENTENTEAFKKTYVEFITKICALWKTAKVYMLLPVCDSENGLRFDTVEAAAKEAAAKNKNAKFISTRSVKTELANDGVTPTAESCRAYSDFILDKLKIKN